MAKRYGWEILLVVLGIATLFNLIVPLITKIEKQQRTTLSIIVFFIIMYLIFRKYTT